MVVIEEDQDDVLGLPRLLLIQIHAGFQVPLKVLLANSISRANPSTTVLVSSHGPNHYCTQSHILELTQLTDPIKSMTIYC